MNTNELLLHYWQINWAAIIIALALISFHLRTNRKAQTSNHLAFLSGVFLFLLVTISPLAFFGRNYLFSAHMIEHIVILLIVPPLLLSGTNPKLLEKLHQSKFRKTGDVLFSTPIAWFLGIGAMYFWHIPALFEAMKKSMSLHIVHILSLLILGIIFIWPVYTPIHWKKLSPLQSALYLFIACVGCTILGILITFGPTSMYMPFFTGSNTAILNLIHTNWGITAAVDQQAAGLIMWVPACFIYITNIMVTLARFYKNQYSQDDKETINFS